REQVRREGGVRNRCNNGSTRRRAAALSTLRLHGRPSQMIEVVAAISPGNEAQASSHETVARDQTNEGRWPFPQRGRLSLPSPARFRWAVPIKKRKAAPPCAVRVLNPPMPRECCQNRQLPSNPEIHHHCKSPKTPHQELFSKSSHSRKH